MKTLLLLLVFEALSLAGNVEKGREIYLEYCANCHSVSMTGGLGKDFNLVSYERKKEEIIRYAANPGNYFRTFGYSANAMPQLPLSEEQITNVADYIDSLQPFKKWMKRKK